LQHAPNKSERYYKHPKYLYPDTSGRLIKPVGLKMLINYRTIRFILLLTILVGLPCFGLAEITTQQHSIHFKYRYEADLDEPIIENPDEWENPFFKPMVNSINGGILNCTFGMNRVWQITGSALEALNHSTGWTFEVRLKVVEQTGSQGVFGLSVDDQAGADGCLNGFQIHAHQTQWNRRGVIADSNANNDGFHVFRLAEEPNLDIVHGWRDGVYLGTANYPGHISNMSKHLFFGSWSSQVRGTVEIDYVRWDPTGPFAPLPESRIKITESDGCTEISEEARTSDNYTISLTQAPQAEVTITVDPNVGEARRQDVDLGNGVGLQVTLIFTAENWNTPQTVTVTATDDTLFEWFHQATIRNLATSEDSVFNQISELLTVNIVDNDSVLQLIESEGTTKVAETGETSDSYQLICGLQPKAEVSILLTFNSTQLALGTEKADSFSLTFNSQNWERPQTIELCAVDNALIERLKTSIISHTVRSSDSNYDGFVLPDLVVRVVDNDFAHTQPDGYTIPTIDLDQDFRQVVIDRRPGQYLGHPTTVLLADSQTILTVYPTGHGRGAIQYKRSQDKGLTWSELLPTPVSWTTSREVPTLFRMTDPGGKERIILFSGLYPARRAFSEDNGETWSELEPVGDWGGIVVMGCFIRLKDGRYLAMFHDDGRFFQSAGRATGTFKVYQTYSADGGLTWSFPEVVIDCDWAAPCEPGIIRSPDGNQLLVLLRENSRQYNSFFITSNDESETWSPLQELPAALTGDRHTGQYAPDGRLFISFRDLTHDSPTRGDWVGWVGKYDDIINGREGEYRVRLKDNLVSADCAYPGVEILPDGMFVVTTYGHWLPGEEAFIVSTRFKLEELEIEHEPLVPGEYKIITFGNSTTAPRGELVVYADLLRQELPRANFTSSVLNRGVGGNSTQDALIRFNQDVISENPDIVIIQFGLNDASVDVWKNPPVLTPRISVSDYKTNLQQMVHELKARNIRVILLTPNAMSWNDDPSCGTTYLYAHNVPGTPYQLDDPNGVNTVLADYIHAVREVSIEEKVQLVDIFSEFISFNNVAGQNFNELLLDGMHPNAQGQRIVADAIYKVLDITIPPVLTDSLVKKSSDNFRYRYEADLASPEIENPNEWSFPFSKPQVNSVNSGDPPNSILNCTFTQDQMWKTVGIEPHVLDHTKGWTFEVRLKILNQTGTRGAVALSVDDLAGASGHVNGFQIHADRTQWCIDRADADTMSNSDKFHVFRLAEEPNSDQVHGWRDGIYLGSSSQPFNFPQAVLAKYLLVGSWSGQISGTVEIDYIRWEPTGAFAPEKKSNQVKSRSDKVPSFNLQQNFPNPFNPTTTIKFQLPYRTEVQLEIFNLTGQKIRTLYNQSLPAGVYVVNWYGNNENFQQVAAGIYFYKLTANKLNEIKKMLLLR